MIEDLPGDWDSVFADLPSAEPDLRRLLQTGEEALIERRPGDKELLGRLEIALAWIELIELGLEARQPHDADSIFSPNNLDRFKKLVGSAAFSRYVNYY